MKTLGVIGGMSWESTATYYKLLNEGVRDALGGLHSAPVLLHSVDFAGIAALQKSGEWHVAGEQLAQVAQGLQRAGAGALLLATNTYERIYLDTPPALNFYAVSALIAADRVLIPFDCDSFSRQALYGLIKEVEELREDHNEDLQVEGIIVNQFQPRASLPQQMLDELIAEGLPVLPVYLNASVKMRESHEASKPLIYLEPRHKLTQQFVELHHWLETNA